MTQAPAIDFTDAACRILAKVGLTFDDVYFRQGAERHSGSVHFPTGLPCFRTKPLISLAEPIDNVRTLHTLAHECGHVHHGLSSIPYYIQEYEAEIYANAEIERVLGFPVPNEILQDGKRYVAAFCQARYDEFEGRFPQAKGWSLEVIQWCGWQMPEGLREQIEADDAERRSMQEKARNLAIKDVERIIDPAPYDHASAEEWRRRQNIINCYQSEQMSEKEWIALCSADPELARMWKNQNNAAESAPAPGRLR